MGRTSTKRSSAARQAPCRHAHVVEFLGILPKPGARLLGAQDGQLAPQDGIGQLPRFISGPISVEPRSGGPGDDHALSEKAGLELGERGRLQPAGGPQLGTRAVRGHPPTRKDPDLHPPQVHGSLAVPDDDQGVVQGDLAPPSSPSTRSENSDGGSAPGGLACSGRRPATACARRPTGPSGPRRVQPDAA